MDPLSEHVNPVKTASTQIDASDEPVQAVSAPTLTSLQHEFAFFTIGVLYAAVPGLNRDLFRDFLRAVPSLTGGGAGAFSSDKKVFEGLGVRVVHGREVDMDRLIYAVHKSIWEDCRAYIGGAAFIDPKTGGTYRTVVYTIPLVDSVTLSRTRVVTELPTVELTVFAVNAPKHFYYLSVPDYPGLATLKTGPAKTAAELAEMEIV